MIRYRDGEIGDIDAMFRLDKACFRPPFSFHIDTFHYLLHQPGMISIVAENDAGEMLGFILVEPVPPDATCVSTIDVHPDKRRAGLATELLARTMEIAKERKLFKSFLQVYVENDGAIKFYKRLGYRILKRLPSFYGRQRDGFLMYKSYSGEEGAY
jgi:[ribosomal protein S18]-alanine N-acetyltransferase